MNPLLVIAVPLVLVMLGMILNSIGLSFDQPASSPEQDPAKRLDAERQAYRKFFDLQRSRFLTRQKRVGQYGWLVLAVFVASFLWMYFDTVNKTTVSKQIAAIQTMPTAEGKEVVLSVTLSDGNNVKYLIKSPSADTSDAAKDGFSKESVSSWELSSSGTALSMGNAKMPLGIALNISK
ncbi:MAG TPA: hypothetical protein VGR30_01850 [Candidatus Binatia bacterium]|jgi:hypothetical protein|nr:hypothetical protein [Candidatus Binatia bacterium]